MQSLPLSNAPVKGRPTLKPYNYTTSDLLDLDFVREVLTDTFESLPKYRFNRVRRTYEYLLSTNGLINLAIGVRILYDSSLPSMGWSDLKLVEMERNLFYYEDEHKVMEQLLRIILKPNTQGIRVYPIDFNQRNMYAYKEIVRVFSNPIPDPDIHDSKHSVLMGGIYIPLSTVEGFINYYLGIMKNRFCSCEGDHPLNVELLGDLFRQLLIDADNYGVRIHNDLKFLINFAVFFNYPSKPLSFPNPASISYEIEKLVK